MIVVTVDEIQGHEVQVVHGLVTGSVVRAKDLFKDVGAALKGLVGGELRSYSALMSEARNAALVQMVRSAEEAGANAVVGVRMTSGQIARSAAEVYVYGTAVTVVRSSTPDTEATSAEPSAQYPSDTSDGNTETTEPESAPDTLA